MGRVFIFKCEFSGSYMKSQDMFLFEKIYETLLRQISVMKLRQEIKEDGIGKKDCNVGKKMNGGARFLFLFCGISVYNH